MFPNKTIRFQKTFFFFVVWQSVHDPVQTQEKDGDRGFILLQPQSAVLLRSDAGSDGVEPHLVSSFKTVRPIILGGARCLGHVKISWWAICSLAL